MLLLVVQWLVLIDASVGRSQDGLQQAGLAWLADSSAA